MAYRSLAETEPQASLLTDEMQLDAHLSPAQRRHIIRQRLAQLSDGVLLSGTNVARLSHQLTARHYAAGEVILKEGMYCDCLGLVTRGQVATYSSLSNRGRPLVLLLPGDTFGEAMLTDGRPSDSTLRAVTDAEVHFLRRADFLATVEQHQSRAPSTVKRWLRRLAMTTLVCVIVGVSLTLTPTRRAVALVPYGAGLWLAQHGHAEWAETTWTLTQSLTPDWAAPYLSLGNLYFHQGQLDQAQAELEQALFLMPDLAEAHNSLGLLYAAYGDHATAIKAFRQALALEPGQATVEGNLSFSLQLVGQRDEALRHYALSHLLDAPHPVLLTNEAIAHYEAGNLTAAESIARQALDLNDTSAPAYTVLGASHLAQRHPWAARLALEKAARLDPTYSPAHFYLGLAYEALNQPSLAYVAFDYVVSLNPDSLARREAHRHLSELYARYGTTINADQPYLAGDLPESP
jgi:tetratricopeptide (TPR) repeat protein